MRMMLVGAGAVGECILKVLKKRDPKGEWLEYVLISDYSMERAREVWEHLKAWPGTEREMDKNREVVMDIESQKKCTRCEAACVDAHKKSELVRLMKEHEMEADELDFSPENLAKLIELTDEGTINSSVAKEVFEVMLEENVDPEQYVEEKGLKTVND